MIFIIGDKKVIIGKDFNVKFVIVIVVKNEICIIWMYMCMWLIWECYFIGLIE